MSVYAIASNITSSLGIDTTAHWYAAERSISGVKAHNDNTMSDAPFWGSRLTSEQWETIQATVNNAKEYSGFEQLSIYSATNALSSLEKKIDLEDTVLILSTTKGNIEWLEDVEDSGTLLHKSASLIAKYIGVKTTPVVVSHACISGVVSLIYAQRLLESGRYKHAIVVGCDRSTQFVLNGFQSFQAIADGPCRPFDADRKGINLGEAAATIILSTDGAYVPIGRLAGGSSSNDANHISGPSRTGEELALSIKRTMEQAGIQSADIDMISAHGTATPYNDEMEAKAFGLSDVLHAPLHSFKGYTGHTLGAAGLLESAIVLESIQKQKLVPSLGYENLGVSQPVKVCTEMQDAVINNVLKTASGFGGCNASIIWSKV